MIRTTLVVNGVSAVAHNGRGSKGDTVRLELGPTPDSGAVCASITIDDGVFAKLRMLLGLRVVLTLSGEREPEPEEGELEEGPAPQGGVADIGSD